MISGPYRTAARSSEELAARLRTLNLAALEVLRRGHLPIIGVNLALPIIDAAGQDQYESIMMPLSLSLCDRCDAVLRIGGASAGADQEVERFRRANKPVYLAVEQVPINTP